MIDICTVVFRDEIPALECQAQSVALYCQDLQPRNIYVVVNDHESLAQEIDPNWWGTMASRVLVVPRTAFSAPWVEDGWVNQQLWKLLVPSISYNCFTMVLDAKTVITKPIQRAQLVDQQGRLKVGIRDIQPVFEASRQITQELFDIEMTKQIGPAGVPHFFHNDTVRLMIADVTLKTQQSFPAWFQKQGKLTEFILYSGYLLMKYHSLDAIYNTQQEVMQPVNVCHSEVAGFDQKFQHMLDNNTTSVSVHRRAWKQLTLDQQNQYRTFLIDQGIMSGWKL
jgi:hypothetical protein